MRQAEKRIWLLNYLINENPNYSNIKIPNTKDDQQSLLRSLMNVRYPEPITKEFLDIQDSYLKEELKSKKITTLSDLVPEEKSIYLWQGDITTLKVDAIVNAANSQLLGCFVPCHGCIDNAIHSYAGIQLRLECNKLMKEQGYEEPTGKAKITPAYNLPCKYVIHTVGPIINSYPTEIDSMQLASCYRSCLEIAKENGLKSIAFCCISTGEFHFPNEEAAKIAVKTVHEFLKDNEMEVIFNVFKEKDYKIYKQLLGRN